MKLLNTTGYRSDDLRKFFRAGLKALHGRPNVWIYATQNRGPKIHGKAQLGGSWIEMFLPPPDKMRPNYPFLLQLALIYEHEIYHHLGVNHKDMTELVLYSMGPMPEWARGGLSIRVRDKKPAPSIEDKVRAKLDHARDFLKTWETKSRRIATGVKKWKRRVRYYERSLIQVAGSKKKNGR